jgi:hypothetical protein
MRAQEKEVETGYVLHIADSVADEEDDMNPSAFHTISYRDVLRAVSRKAYLHTALPRTVGIEVRCTRCGETETLDASPTYLTLPPLQDHYIAQRRPHCKSKSCLKGQGQTLFVPIDASIQYVSHKEIHMVMRVLPTLTEKLIAMVVDGDESIELTEEEKRRPFKFNRKI